VYNLEIESRSGEVTHNYFVGEDGVLVHNARRPKLTSLGPDPTAGGDPHTTLQFGPDGKPRNAVTWKPNKCDPRGLSPEFRFRFSGPPNGGVNPPFVIPGGGGGAATPL